MSLRFIYNFRFTGVGNKEMKFVICKRCAGDPLFNPTTYGIDVDSEINEPGFEFFGTFSQILNFDNETETLFLKSHDQH